MAAPEQLTALSYVEAKAPRASIAMPVYKAPRVSIGMPVYNAQRYLEGTLDSILAQSFRDFELIISDNGSTDRTEAICRDYASRDSRISYFRHEENRGAGWNFQYVFHRARGEYFKWNAYDDRLGPQFLEKCVALLDRTPEAVLAFTKYVDVDANGKASDTLSPVAMWLPRPHERFRELMPYHNCVEIFGLMRLAVLRQTPGSAAYAAADKVLIVELALHGVFAEVPEVLFFQGWQGENMEFKYPNPRDQHIWFFNARDDGRLVFPHWRVLQEYLRALRRVPLPWKERMLCYWYLLRWEWRSERADLHRELARPAWASMTAFAKKHFPWLRTPWRMWKAFLDVLPPDSVVSRALRFLLLAPPR
jgi:glycosyltransferase involved in cell wall biosynthesis